MNGIAWRRAASGGVALGRLADDADPDLGVAQVVGRLDTRDRREPDPRIRDLTTHDRPDLLAQELVDPLCSLAHENSTAAGVREAREHASAPQVRERARSATRLHAVSCRDSAT